MGDRGGRGFVRGAARVHRATSGQHPFDCTISRAIRSGLVHVRTGRDIGSAWLSLGQHLAEFEAEDSPPTEGVLLHVPRVALGREFEATVTVRPATERSPTAWNGWRVRVGEVLDHHEAPLASPGVHCARCTVECAVRP